MKKPETLPPARSNSIFRRDRSRRAHFITPKNLGTASKRFECFQAFVLNSGHSSLLHPAGWVLASLLAFDGITTEADLRSAYEACQRIVRWGGAARIDWLNGKRVDARNLSSLTVLATQGLTNWSDFETAQAALVRFICQIRPSDYSEAQATSAWSLLLTDATAWYQASIAPVFYAHISGVAPMSALPRSALARESTGQALENESVEDSENASLTTTVTIRAYEAAMRGLSPSLIGSAQFINKIVDALLPPTKGSVAHRRQRVLDQLHMLSTEVDGADEVSVLLFIFSINLMVNGTARLSKLAPDTPYAYVQSFARELRSQLHGQTLNGMASESYIKIFQTLLDASVRHAPYKVAGLKAFHLFLRANWDVPPLPASIFKVDIDAAVAANVVWPAELATIEHWIDTAPSTRFNQQLRTGFSIAGACMIRISELLVLRIANLIDEGSHIVIEIARNTTDGKEKSAEGRRRVNVNDPKALNQIRRWIERRIEEDASPTDYLFGDPANSRKIAVAGKMYFWMNRLLKVVTGDSAVSVHTLRHTVATQKLVAIQNIDVEEEVNPLDVLSNEAGHIGGHVTTVNYCHQFEIGIRQSIDARVRLMPINYAAASVWSGVARSTLRQRVARNPSPTRLKNDILLTAVNEAAKQVRFGTGFSISTTTPTNPLPSHSANPLSYQQVTGLLRDLAAGLSTSQGCLRQDLSEKVAMKVVECVGMFADRYGKPEPLLSDFLTLGLKSLQDSSGALLGVVPDFSRLSHARWAALAHAIDRSESLLLSNAVQYWSQSLRDHHLSVRPGANFDQFVALLSGAGINSNQFVLKWTAVDRDKTIDCLAMAQASFRRHFGRTVHDMPQPARGGRPAIWLVIASDAALIQKNGSANSMTGLHCLMLSALVWLKARELSPKSYEVSK